jgi:valacyclovir hydrolase
LPGFAPERVWCCADSVDRCLILKPPPDAKNCHQLSASFSNRTVYGLPAASYPQTEKNGIVFGISDFSGGVMPYFTAPDGWQLHYREAGSGSLVMVLPGSTASSVYHQNDIQRLKERYRAVSLDFRGTGQSGRMGVWPNDWWQQAARDVSSLIAHLGYESAALIGTSGGAIIALWCAILFPDQLSAVVADSVGHHLPPERLREEIANRRKYDPDSVRFWQDAHGDDWRQVIEADCEFMLEKADRGAEWFGEELAKVRCPVLISGSLSDEFYPDLPEQARQMAQQLPEAQVFLVDGGNHPLIWSRADDFYRAAESFLAKHAYR